MRDLYGIGRRPSPTTAAGPARALAQGLASDAPDAGPARRSTGRPFPFLTVEGDGVYEIPVGPVHAGLIEPGHFRFSVVGETILKMKARLWYVHKGIEKLFEGERLTDAVALANGSAVTPPSAQPWPTAWPSRTPSASTLPDEAQRIRAMLLELERLHNHIADIGALLQRRRLRHRPRAHPAHPRNPAAAQNRATGHRLLRGGIRPVVSRWHGLPDAGRLRSIAADLAEVAELTLGNTVVYDRFAGTSVLGCDDARAMGLFGMLPGQAVSAPTPDSSIP